MKSLVKVVAMTTALFYITAQAVKADQKLGHINSVVLLQAMPEVEKANAEFQDYQKAKQKVLEDMDAERMKKINIYQEKTKNRSEANKDVVDKELQTLASEIQGLEKRITEAERKVQDDLKTKQAELYQPIFSKAEQAVKVVAKEKGLSYVFDVSQPNVVYFDGGDNIMVDVIKQLGLKTPSGSTSSAPTPFEKPTNAPAGKRFKKN